MEEIFRQRERWLDFVSSKPEGIRDALNLLRMHKAVGSQFRLRTMLADISKGLEDLAMARGKSSAKGYGKSGSWKERLLNIPMGNHSAEDVKYHYGDAVALMDGIDAVVQSGYKLSLSYNIANDNFVASLTGRLEGSPNYEYTISGFAPTWDLAVGVLLYKHFIIAQEGVWAEYARQRSYGDIG